MARFLNPQRFSRKPIAGGTETRRRAVIGAATLQPPVITALQNPQIQSVEHGDQELDLFRSIDLQASSYASTEGAIQTPVPQVSFDGGETWAAADTDALSYGNNGRARIRVFDDAVPANERFFPSASGQAFTVAGIAPSATLNVDLSGRTVTAWLTSISGTPTPTPGLDTFTAGGSDVSGSVTGAGTAGDPWTYVVPSSASSTPIVIGASLDNGVAPAWSDTDSSITVAADYIAPSYTVSLGALVAGQTVGRPGSGADVEAVLGGAAGVPDDPLTWELGVNGSYTEIGPSVTVPVFEGDEMVFRISDPDHPTGSFVASSTSVTVSAEPEITGTAPSLAAMTEGDTLDAAVTWGSATPPSGETMTGASPVRQMSIDGAAWTAYVGSTAPTAGQTARVRETWETVEGTGPTTFTSNQVTVAASTDQLTITDFNEASDTLDLTSTEAGTCYYGIYPSGTVSGDITVADMVAGTDTGLVDSGTAGVFVAAGTLDDEPIDDAALASGAEYVIAFVVDIDDGGTYTNLALQTFTTAGAAPEITSVTATPYGARIEYVGTLAATATPYGAKVEAS